MSILERLEKEKAAILDGSGELLTQDQTDRVNAINTDLQELKTKVNRQTEPAPIGTIPAVARQPHGLKCFSSERNALDFGRYLQSLTPQGVQAGMVEDTNSAGGYLVPSELSADLIRLVEERGVFRKESRLVRMSSDSINLPRQTAGATAYAVGEADAITESQLTLDLVTLTLKKFGCLSSFTHELNEDALINIADSVGSDFAYRLADKEDECGFNGAGGATYHGIVGVRQALIEAALGGDETGAVPAASGLVRYGTGYGYTNIGMDDLTQMIGRLPQYAEANGKWYMSKFVWSYILDLLADAGGNTIRALEAGGAKTLLGYDVIVSQVMPKAAAINQVCVLLGDLRLASSMGVDRAGVRVEASNSAVVGSTSMFETDQTAIRGIERFDIVNHDCGSTTEAGPIVGLLSHTS